jgi:hypothetical protein
MAGTLKAAMLTPTTGSSIPTKVRIEVRKPGAPIEVSKRVAIRARWLDRVTLAVLGLLVKAGTAGDGRNLLRCLRGQRLSQLDRVSRLAVEKIAVARLVLLAVCLPRVVATTQAAMVQVDMVPAAMDQQAGDTADRLDHLST